jgi:DNA-binding NtrC family response regulator
LANTILTEIDTMNRRVLVVDDHDGFRNLIGAFLSKKFEVLGAKNGLEAMTWLSGGIIPDAIVMDTFQTGAILDGEKLLANLHCSGLFSSIPVIVMGEHDNELLEQRYRQLGAVAYFRKPFNPDKLHEQLEQCTRSNSNN